MIFELENRQRIFFGLEQVNEELVRNEIDNDLIYYTNKKGYIVKISYIYEYDDFLDSNGEKIKYRFDEFDTFFKLHNDKIIISESKNKVKDINKDNLYALKPTGIRFHWCRTVEISLDKNSTTYYDSQIENICFFTFEELRKWIDKYIAESDENEIEKIENYKKEKSKRIIAKDGDFFAFKLNRWEYGYGRVIDNLFQKYSSNKDFFENNNNLGLRFLNSPVLIKVYLYKSKEIDVDLNELKKSISFPTFVIRDYQLLKGEYKIIGNQTLEDFEFDYPISCGLYSPDKDYPYITSSFFNWGYINYFKEDVSWYQNSFYNRYRNKTDVTHYNIQSCIDIELFERCYNANNIDLFWKKYYVEIDEIMKTEINYHRQPMIDLRSPYYEKYKIKLFNFFGIDNKISYHNNFIKFKKTSHNSGL